WRSGPSRRPLLTESSEDNRLGRFSQQEQMISSLLIEPAPRRTCAAPMASLWKVSVGETVGVNVSGRAKYWSEWQGLNLRPPRPERGALPDCATLRLKAGLITRVRERPQAIDPNDRAGGNPGDRGRRRRDHARRRCRRTCGAHLGRGRPRRLSNRDRLWAW